MYAFGIILLTGIALIQFIKNIKPDYNSENLSNISEHRSEIESLRDQMELAVKEDRFEDAAVLRDKILELIETKKDV